MARVYDRCGDQMDSNFSDPVIGPSFPNCPDLSLIFPKNTAPKPLGRFAFPSANFTAVCVM
jgi:hypothetical protein